MGLDRFHKTPCGFCFVEYYTHQDALDCMKYVGGTKLDERIIRTDLDPGFQEGRQYGYVTTADALRSATLTFPQVEVNRAVRFAMSIGMSLILEEVDMAELWLRNGRRKRTSMELAGSCSRTPRFGLIS